LLRPIEPTALTDEKLVQLILDLSHLGDNMQKYRPENDNFKTLFGEKARIVLSKTLERFTAEELGHLSSDILFILRALVKYNELDLETLKSFSE
jgi:hypothetical protein